MVTTESVPVEELENVREGGYRCCSSSMDCMREDIRIRRCWEARRSSASASVLEVELRREEG